MAFVAVGTETPRSSAKSWTMPLLPNSPEPMAKVPSANATSISITLRSVSRGR